MTRDNEPAPDLDRVEEALSRFLDGEPEPGDGGLLIAAMQRDARFAHEVTRLLAMDDLIRQASDPDPSAFAEAVQARVSAEENAGSFIDSLCDRLPAVTQAAPQTPARGPRRGKHLSWLLALAASCLVAFAGWSFLRNRADPDQEVAWLVNAQNCRWAEGTEPTRGLTPGKVVCLEQGLAELSFPNGVRAVLEGPVKLEVRSAVSVRLLRGGMAVRVPEAGRGFEVLSPEGKVIDLGTEFGIRVADDGSAHVHVFRGEVEVVANEKSPAPVSVKERQSADINGSGIVLGQEAAGAREFVREIVPTPVLLPRTMKLTFREAKEGGLLDARGRGTGLTHRLPGTGSALLEHDANLHLHPEKSLLELKTTENDLNKQYKIAQGEYVGLRLSDLGFTGTEDFEVTAHFPTTPALGVVDQFGLYAGSRSDRHIRGGLMRPGGNRGIGPSTQFFVGNDGGPDAHLHMIGLVSMGAELAMTLRRVAGKYSLAVENRTNGESSALTIRHPAFLDGERDLYVGIFGATPRRNVSLTLPVEELRATVWVRR